MLLLVFNIVTNVNADEETAAEPAPPKEPTAEDKAIESGESFQFQAEVNRLMDIIINSLCKYSLPMISCLVDVNGRQKQRSIPS